MDTTTALSALGLFVSVIALAKFFVWLHSRSGEWTVYRVPPWRRSPILGEDYIMRRWESGGWEHRKMTPDETEEHLQSSAW